MQFVDKTDTFAAVDGFTSCWLTRDSARMATLMTDDFILWNNCSKVELAKDVAIAFNNWLGTVMWNSRYGGVKRMLTPTGIIQQHLSSFDSDSGAFNDIPMLVIFTTRGRKVARCDEYLDSTGLPRLEWPEGTKFLS